MQWTTPTGLVALSDAEVTALADAAARYDVLGGHGFNPSPMVDVNEALAAS